MNKQQLELEYGNLSRDIEELLEKLQKRDDIYINFQKENDPDFDNEKTVENIKKYIDDLIGERTDIWNYVSDINEKQEEIKRDYDEQLVKAQDCPITVMESDYMKGRKEREYKFIEYNVLVNKENIILLYFLILTLFIILLMNILFFFQIVQSKVIVISLCIIVLTIYVFYLLKIAVLDRVNRNNIFFNKLDFNKPNEVETRKSRSIADGEVEENKCDSEYENVPDTVIQDRKKLIKDDALSQKSKDKCITEK
jgi:hypothetical protein